MDSMEVPGFQTNLRQSIYACKLLFTTCYPQETQMSLLGFLGTADYRPCSFTANSIEDWPIF